MRSRDATRSHAVVGRRVARAGVSQSGLWKRARAASGGVRPSDFGAHDVAIHVDGLIALRTAWVGWVGLETNHVEEVVLMSRRITD
jgi:hypothetical protein